MDANQVPDVVPAAESGVMLAAAVSCRTLIVEDDPSGREVLEMILSRLGHQVESARTIHQALKLLPDTQKDDWYEYLFRRMREGALSLNAFLQNGLRVVTFNYERSLEQFFVTALQRTYGVKPPEIAQAPTAMTIFGDGTAS